MSLFGTLGRFFTFLRFSSIFLRSLAISPLTAVVSQLDGWRLLSSRVVHTEPLGCEVLVALGRPA